MSNVLFKPVYDGARVQKRSYRRMEAWDDHKEFVLDLWKNKVKHERILETLRTERNFHANANQLKRQLGLWGISKKNLNKKQRKWIIQITEKRKLEGKATRFYFSDTGLDIPESQLAGVWKAGLDDIPDDIPPSPGELLAETPPPEREEVAGPSSNDMEDTHETADDMDVETATGMIVSAEPGSEIPPEENIATDINIDVNAEINIPIVSIEADEEIIREAPESVSGVLEEDIEAEAPSSLPFRVVDLLGKSGGVQSGEIDLYTDIGLESDIVNSGGRSVSDLKIYDQVIIFKAEEANDSTGDAYLEVCNALDQLNLNETEANEDALDSQTDTRQYTKELTTWFEYVTDIAKDFLILLERALRLTRLPFSDCFLELYQYWLRERDEAYPYPVLLAIVHKTPIKPLLGSKTSILTTAQWDRVLEIYYSYYDELKGYADNAAQSDETDEDPLQFRSKVAHLPYLLQELGGSSYFTITSLSCFADLVYTACYSHQSPEQKFLLEMAYKANSAIGMELHTANFEIAEDLGQTHFEAGDYASALRFQRLTCAIQSRQHGISSISAIQILPEIALSYWKLREKTGALTIIKMTLRIIRDHSAQLVEDRDDHLMLLSTIYEIGRLLMKMKCKPESKFVFRYAISLYQDFISREGAKVDDPFIETCSAMGKMYGFLGNDLTAIELFQYTSKYFSSRYGELYDIALREVWRLYEAVDKRGMTIQIAPTVERLWRIYQTNARKEDEDRTWAIWMMYSNAVFKVNGLDDELRSLARYLEN